MSFTKESAVERAKKDLAKRLNTDAGSIEESGVSEKEFPDMSLGSPADDEMSAQMISSGWTIKLSANGKVLRHQSGKRHILTKKTRSRKRRLRKEVEQGGALGRAVKTLLN